MLVFWGFFLIPSSGRDCKDLPGEAAHTYVTEPRVTMRCLRTPDLPKKSHWTWRQPLGYGAQHFSLGLTPASCHFHSFRGGGALCVGQSKVLCGIPPQPKNWTGQLCPLVYQVINQDHQGLWFDGVRGAKGNAH